MGIHLQVWVYDLHKRKFGIEVHVCLKKKNRKCACSVCSWEWQEKLYILERQRCLWHSWGDSLGKDRREGWLYFFTRELTQINRRQEVFILVTSDLKISQSRKKKMLEYSLIKVSDTITLPRINGRKSVKVDLSIRPAISFPFRTSSQHQKLFPSTFQVMICLISLSLPFHSRPISSESFSTEVRSVSYLDFQSSHNKHSNYCETCCQHADSSASGTHTGKVWNNFLAPLS